VCLEATRRIARAIPGAIDIASARAGSATATALATTVLKEMLMTRVKVAFGLVVLAGVVGVAAGAVALSAHTPAEDPPKKDSPPAKKEDPAAKEAKLLEGEWKVVAVEADGHEAGPDDNKRMRWVIKGNEIQATYPDGDTGKMTFKIDPGKKPKQIDLIAPEGATKGTDPGIYKLEGGRLTVCLRSDMSKGKGRPTEFDGGPGLGMITFERVKK
jgi:uncharacterized protein (TIGR03067 family)